MDRNMAPGFHSMASLRKRFGPGSGKIEELKRIIACKRWLCSWVYLLFTGERAHGCVCATSSGKENYSASVWPEKPLHLRFKVGNTSHFRVMFDWV